MEEPLLVPNQSGVETSTRASPGTKGRPLSILQGPTGCVVCVRDRIDFNVYNLFLCDIRMSVLNSETVNKQLYFFYRLSLREFEGMDTREILLLMTFLVLQEHVKVLVRD